MTQRQIVAAHLKSAGNISSMEAFKMYQITRLPAVVFDLRKTMHIISKDESVKNQYGVVHYTRYFLEEEDGRKTDVYSENN